jgi:CMP-N-acetylneuraminic acid synthetase
MSNKLTAVVPVRKGSIRVPNKSTREFGNTTLIEYKLETLKKITSIDEIVVATDCEICIEKSIEHNVNFKIRDEYHTSSKCTNSELMYNLAEIIDTDYFMYTPPTAPFISIDTYNDFIESFKMKLTYDYDSLTAVERISCHTWYNNKPLNYKLDDSSNSQDLPKVDLIGYGLSLILRDSILKTRNVIGEVPAFYPLSTIESWDINSLEEFTIAEYIYDGLRKD